MTELGITGTNASKQNNWNQEPSKRPLEYGEVKTLLWHAMWAFKCIYSDIPPRSVVLIFTRYKQVFTAQWIDLLTGMHPNQLEQVVLFLNWTVQEEEDMTELLPRLCKLVVES